MRCVLCVQEAGVVSTASHVLELFLACMLTPPSSVTWDSQAHLAVPGGSPCPIGPNWVPSTTEVY